MQEIEFRAWIETIKKIKKVVNIHFKTEFITVETLFTNGVSILESYESEVATLIQYIGIKDIHQKKVFQGDIVKVKRFIFKDCRREEVVGMEEYIGEVVWHQFGWHVAEKIEDGIKYHSLWLWNIKDDESDPDTHFMEILGNRWDNPEMKVIA